MTGGSIDTNFPHQLLLTKRHVLKLCKAFEKNQSVNKKLSKAHLSKQCNQEDFLIDFLDQHWKLEYLYQNVQLKNWLTGLLHHLD